MGYKWLHEELSENTSDSLYYLFFASTLSNPSSGLRPCLIQSQKPTLPPPFDQLVWFRDEADVVCEKPGIGALSLVEDSFDGGVFREVEGGELWRRVVSLRRRQRGGLNDFASGEVVVENGLAISLED